MNRRCACSLLIVCGLCFSGCMVVQGPAFKDMQPALTSKAASAQPLATPRIQVLVNAKHFANGKAAPNTSTKSDYEKVFDAVLSEQRLFKEIGLKAKDPEWQAMVDIREEEKFNMGSLIISACTLLVIPTVPTVDLQATVKVLDARGEQVAVLNARQDVKIVIELLFLIPWRASVIEEAQRNLARDIVLQLRELVVKKGLGEK